MRTLTCRLLVATALAAIPAAAQAQTQYDANCQPSAPSEEQLFQQEVCKSHAGCAMVVSAGQGFCKGVDFFRQIGDKITGTQPLTNDDVIEVVELDYPKSTFTSRIMDKVKSATSAVFGSKPEQKTFAIGDGSKFAYSETLPAGAGQRAGAIVYSDGAAARGRFNDSFVNNGIGERVSATGQVSAGEFRDAALSGEGFKTEGNGKDAEMYEGTFDNDVPVGEVVHRFADGTSARELWQNGKMVERGLLAARGKDPPPLPSTLSLASAKPDGDGMFERPGPDGRWRQELWCKGRIVDAGTWADKGKAIAPQTKDRWKKDCPQHADAEEVESKDLVQPPLTRGSAKAPGGLSDIGTYGGSYATMISEPGLPASFYARYTGHNLTKEECLNQNNALGWSNAGFDRNDTVLMLRAAIALTEAGIIIIRQCENNPQAVKQMQIWATQRSAAIATCRQVATDPAICLRSPF